MNENKLNELLYTLSHSDMTTMAKKDKEESIEALESGQILFFPDFYFKPFNKEISELFSASILDNKHKNVSYDIQKGKLGGLQPKNLNGELGKEMKSFMHAYAGFARELIDNVLPQYRTNLLWGRTSYRPAEIEGRATSKRKDDTRLHIDAFAATPVNGLRILRVFCNINPFGEPRIWHLGEPFSKVATQFAPKIPNYKPKIAKLLHFIKATKTLRSAYDHYQLQLHDMMKLDDAYQANVSKSLVPFPSQSTWIVYTDHVSHAALSGQFLLEQTFYLPVAAMQREEHSPWHFWNTTFREQVVSV